MAYPATIETARPKRCRQGSRARTQAGIAKEIHDALTDHSEGKVYRDYGEYCVRAVLYPAIKAMLPHSIFKTRSQTAYVTRAKIG